MNDELVTQPVESCIHQMLDDLKELTEREPTKTVAVAFGVGLLINLLPTRVLVGAVTVVGATLMRPVLLSLGVAKALELCCDKKIKPPIS